MMANPIYKYFQNWLQERTTYHMTFTSYTHKLSTDYHRFAVENRDTQALPKKTFVTQLKRKLKNQIHSEKVVYVYRKGACFKGITLSETDKDVNPQNF